MAEIEEVCLKILEQNIDEVDTLLERKYGRRSRGMDHFEEIMEMETLRRVEQIGNIAVGCHRKLGWMGHETAFFHIEKRLLDAIIVEGFDTQMLRQAEHEDDGQLDWNPLRGIKSGKGFDHIAEKNGIGLLFPQRLVQQLVDKEDNSTMYGRGHERGELSCRMHLLDIVESRTGITINDCIEIGKRLKQIHTGPALAASHALYDVASYA